MQHHAGSATRIASARVARGWVQAPSILNHSAEAVQFVKADLFTEPARATNKMKTNCCAPNNTNIQTLMTWDQAVTSAGSSTVMRLNAPVRGQQHDQGEFCTRSIDASQVWRALRSTTKWLGRPRTTRSRTKEGSLRDGANAPREGNPQ